jgi:hypothetical protein
MESPANPVRFKLAVVVASDPREDGVHAPIESIDDEANGGLPPIRLDVFARCGFALFHHASTLRPGGFERFTG